jgi:hypothetical protein
MLFGVEVILARPPIHEDFALMYIGVRLPKKMAGLIRRLR